jgi:DNA-binding transcriptional LysR family regulator
LWIDADKLNLSVAGMIDLRSLSTFVWVAQLRNFHHAASKLNTTQPTVSQRIAQLERDFGVKLLDRGTRSVALTEAGRTVLAYAERMLRLRNEMVAAVSDPGSLRGSLRLGVAETIVHTWLPQFLERMSAAYPRIVLEIDVDISANLRERLLQQHIDLTFMVGPVGSAAIRHRPLRNERVAFLASPRLGLPKRQVGLRRLAEFPLITFSRNTQPFADVTELFADPALAQPRIHASSSIATIVKMALDGLGVAAIPPSIVRDEIKARRLVEVDCEARLPDLHFVAGWLATPAVGIVEPVVEIATDVSGMRKDGTRRSRRK